MLVMGKYFLTKVQATSLTIGASLNFSYYTIFYYAHDKWFRESLLKSSHEK